MEINKAETGTDQGDTGKTDNGEQKGKAWDLQNEGGTLNNIKERGGWKSETTAKHYVSS